MAFELTCPACGARAVELLNNGRLMHCTKCGYRELLSHEGRRI